MAREKKKDIFQSIAEHWFLTEPALFATYCSHNIKANSTLSCIIRSGRGCIEYNPTALSTMPEYVIEEYLRAEVFRILLKHPYERKPFNCSDMACTLASDCVLSSYYMWQKISLAKAKDFDLPDKQHYEWYALEIEKLLNKEDINNGTSNDAADNDTDNAKGGEAAEPSDNNDDNSTAEGNNTEKGKEEYTEGQDLPDNATSISEQSEMWEEDSLMQTTINDIIQNIKSWGTIPGNIVEVIIASTKARIDYRKVLSGFRASIISSKRNLTRMRPNRRTGFQNMGSLYRFRTNLLVGIDVSGSVDSKTLQHVYSVVNRFFAYGIENIDVVQFDCSLGTVRNLSKAMRKVEITGRGGTDFQPVIDYAFSNNYDGLVIFTDGYAPSPIIPKSSHTKLLWVCQDDSTFKTHHEWMEKTGRACVIYI